MKHTYLYPLPERARFLWMLGRASSADLFGYPDDDHAAGWQTTVRLDEELAHARSVVMRLIENAPRVCLGRGYIIPDSQKEAHTLYAEPSHSYTRTLTRVFWDAPKLEESAAQGIPRFIAGQGHVPARDSVDEIRAFLTQHIGQLIIPVWM